MLVDLCQRGALETRASDGEQDLRLYALRRQRATLELERLVVLAS